MSRYPDIPPARDLQNKGREGCLAKEAQLGWRLLPALRGICRSEGVPERMDCKALYTGRLQILAQAQEGKGTDDLRPPASQEGDPIWTLALCGPLCSPSSPKHLMLLTSEPWSQSGKPS